MTDGSLKRALSDWATYVTTGSLCPDCNSAVPESTKALGSCETEIGNGRSSNSGGTQVQNGRCTDRPPPLSRLPNPPRIPSSPPLHIRWPVRRCNRSRPSCPEPPEPSPLGADNTPFPGRPPLPERSNNTASRRAFPGTDRPPEPSKDRWLVPAPLDCPRNSPGQREVVPPERLLGADRDQKRHPPAPFRRSSGSQHKPGEK